MTVHTVGGVITPAEPVMLIVPQANELVVEERVSLRAPKQEEEKPKLPIGLPI
jgi:hypothetical protein